MTSQTSWTIAQMADDFDVTHRALRHYEHLGLLAPERVGPGGNTRIYQRRDRTRLSLILRGRRLGFTLEEIGTIIDMYDEQPGEVGQLEYLLSQIGDRRADLERRAADISTSLEELADLEQRCRADLAARRR
ncbi:MAG: MerR family DNA-binding transcriptional regulator [Ornithinimicrobium sp.]